MGKFIHIRSDKFPILPGEEDEIINEVIRFPLFARRIGAGGSNSILIPLEQAFASIHCQQQATQLNMFVRMDLRLGENGVGQNFGSLIQSLWLIRSAMT
jgi:hypothetical protein